MKQLSVLILIILCSNLGFAQSNTVLTYTTPQVESLITAPHLSPKFSRNKAPASSPRTLLLESNISAPNVKFSLEKFKRAAQKLEKNGKGKPIIKGKLSSIRPFSDAPYDTLIDGHIARCASSLKEQENPDSIFGYLTGTIGKIPLQGGNSAYINMHAVNVQVPRPSRVHYDARVKSVRLGLGSIKTQIVDEPDSFYVNVFNLTPQNRLQFVGRQGFTLESYIDAIQGGEVIEIPFTDTVPAEGNMIFAVETNVPERFTNDTITFQHTFHLPMLCGPTRWFIFVNEEGTHRPITVTRIGNLIGDTTIFGNPYIVPVIEYYPANSTFRVYDEHIEVCRNNQRFYPRANPVFGYFNGTTSRGPLNAGGQRLYISQHGLEKQIPPPPAGYKNRVDGLFVRFAPTTRRVFTADTFHVNVYSFNNNIPNFLGRQRFRLNDPRFIQQPIDGQNYHYIEFEEDIPVSGNTIFALETKTATSNDTITFFFTIPGRSDTLNCGHQWRIFLADSATHQPFRALPLYNSIFENNNNDFFGNPCFVPVIEYYRERLSVDAGNDVTIRCGAETILNATVTNAGPDVSYSWEPTTGLSNPNIPNPIARPLETTTYTVTVKSGNQVAKDAVTVTVLTPFRADAGRDQVISCGDSVMLGSLSLPLPHLRFKWEPSTGLNNPNSQNPIAKPIQTTSYTLTVTDGTCSSRDTVIVRVNPLEIKASASANTIICGDEVKLEAVSVSGVTFEWSPSTWLESPRTASTIARPETTITYSVRGKKGECEAAARVTISVTPLTVDAGQWRTLRKGETANLQARSNKIGAAFSWEPTTYLDNPNIINPKSTPEQTITYTVTAKNGNCTARDTVTLHVTIPTSVAETAKANIIALYPNPTDGKCFIEYNGSAPSVTLRVYNLQGQLIIARQIEANQARRYELDLSAQAKGIYNVELSDGVLQRSLKLQVK
jgi:hypothetical protein